MITTPAEFLKQIESSLKTKNELESVCDELIAFLFRSRDPFPIPYAEKIMKLLRGETHFDLMIKVGDAFIRSGRTSLTIQRQFAQGAIEKKQFDLALFILNDILNNTLDSTDKKAQQERAEALGLSGRVYKQLFADNNIQTTERYVPSDKKSADAAEKTIETDSPHEHYLNTSIRYYYQAYSTDTDNVYQGINTLALLVRAEKEKIAVSGEKIPSGKELAASIIETIEQKELEKVDAWDYATAAEAYIAIEEFEKALPWIEKYIAHPGCTSFAVKGTLRQFTEIWQLDKNSKGSPVLKKLEEACKQKDGKPAGKTDPGPEQQDEGYQSTFGDDRYKSLEWYEQGLKRCYAVARIGVEVSKGEGTGFLIKGSVLSPKLDDNYVLITNEHVVNDSEAVTDTIRSSDAIVIFEKISFKETFPVRNVYWCSPRLELDICILQFHPEHQERINEIGRSSEPFPVARELPIIEKTQRIYVIGHPAGGTLSLSLQDNELLDHKDPKIHYRTPTDKGSSGSPVFNRVWKLIGVHHKGHPQLPRLDDSGETYAANEGIWIKTIIKTLQDKGY